MVIATLSVETFRKCFKNLANGLNVLFENYVADVALSCHIALRPLSVVKRQDLIEYQAVRE